MKTNIHITLTGGKWYAFARKNNKETRLLLVPAIAFCNNANCKQKRRGDWRIAANKILRKMQILPLPLPLIEGEKE